VWRNYKEVCLAKIGVQRIVEFTMVVSIAKSAILTGRKRAHEWYIWKNYNQVCLAKIGVQRIVESTIVVYIARPASLNDLASEECLIQGGEITRRKKTWNGFVSRKSMIRGNLPREF
jgi:hypothetical protein